MSKHSRQYNAIHKPIAVKSVLCRAMKGSLIVPHQTNQFSLLSFRSAAIGSRPVGRLPWVERCRGTGANSPPTIFLPLSAFECLWGTSANSHPTIFLPLSVSENEPAWLWLPILSGWAERWPDPQRRPLLYLRMEGQTAAQTAPPALSQVPYFCQIPALSTFSFTVDDEEMKRWHVMATWAASGMRWDCLEISLIYCVVGFVIIK